MTKTVSSLVRKLKKASAAYYNSDKPTMTDAEFDKLRDELEELDPNHPFLSEIGAPPTDNSLQKVKHVIPMGSLKKMTELDHITTWFKSFDNDAPIQFLIQHKMDGVSIELWYENGEFIKAVTRGDGFEGDDVTHTIKNAKGIPFKIKTGLTAFVRCEAVFHLDDFEKHLAKDTANPRNAVAGTVRRSEGTNSNLIQCYAFDVVIEKHPWQREQTKLDWLRGNGFQVVETAVMTVNEATDRDLYNAFKVWESKRKKLNFEVDGCVVKIDSEAVQNRLGAKDLVPYWAKAWKFPPIPGISVVRSVTWSMGSRGTINPVAVVDPVKIAGVTVTNVSLHNMEEIKRLGVRIGSKVEIVRRGDVIPQISKVISVSADDQKIELKKCPSCGSKVVQEGPFYKCSNVEDCDDVKTKRIANWIRKRNILHLGDVYLEKLVNSGAVTCVRDLYRINGTEMIASGIGEGMTDKILAGIEKSRDITLPDLIGSLSIDLLGRSEAENIYNFGIKTVKQWRELTADQLMQFDGFKDTKSGRICDSLRLNWKLIEELLPEMRIKQPQEFKPMALTKSTLAFKSFCFTGKMSQPREELEQLVIENGGSVGSVSKNLTYLVCADPDSGSSKLEKATRLGVKVISEQQFKALLQ